MNQVEVKAPQAEVFDYVTDPTRFPEWQDNVVGGHMAGTTAIGSKCNTTRRIGGKEREVTSEVTKYNPPSSWAIHGIDGPIRALVEVTVEPVTDTDRTRVTISIDFEGHGIGKALVPLVVKPQSRKEMQRNMTRLKARLEATT